MNMNMETTAQTGVKKRAIAIAAGTLLLVGGAIAGTTYFLVAQKTVYIEKATIEAPSVSLAPSAGGTLQNIDVNVGAFVPANTVVAQVGVSLIKTAAAGLITATHGDVGKYIAPGQTVVEMIDPAALRVVGSVQEDKGLADLQVGQVAEFTVDAYGSQKFVGVVDEIAPQASNGDVVFSISDKRQQQNFDVKIKYDTAKYPQLRQGMSAKIWVYKK